MLVSRGAASDFVSDGSGVTLKSPPLPDNCPATLRECHFRLKLYPKTWRNSSKGQTSYSMPATFGYGRILEVGLLVIDQTVASLRIIQVYKISARDAVVSKLGLSRSFFPYFGEEFEVIGTLDTKYVLMIGEEYLQ
jgi:hypothetical protein